MRKAIDLLAEARKPLVITGSGVLWARAEEDLRNFVEATGIPFFTTPQGRGVVAEDHARSFPAARSTAFREADVVLVIGARANSMLSFLRAPRFSPDAKFINVNVDGREIGHNRAPEIGIIGDAKNAADYPDLGCAIVANLASVDIDVDKLGIGGEARRAQEGKHRIGAGADHQDDVGFAKGG